MKGTILSLMALLASLTASAQTVKVYKTYNEGGKEQKVECTIVDADSVVYTPTSQVDVSADILPSLGDLRDYGAQPFKGKKILVIGDDYAWQNNFGQYLSKATGAEVRARGIKGGKLADAVGNRYNAKGATSFTSEAFDSKLLSNYAVVVVVAGVQNWASGQSIGTMSDGTSAKTVIGETKKVIESILDTRYSVKVVFCTQGYCGTAINGIMGYDKNAAGFTLEQTMDAIKQCASYYSIPVYDFYHEGGWNVYSIKAPFGTNKYTSDGVTPRSGDGNGADLFGSSLGRFINSMPQ